MYKIEDIDKTSAAAGLLAAASLAALLLARVPLGAALQGPAAGRPACRPAAAAVLATHNLGVLFFCTILYGTVLYCTVLYLAAHTLGVAAAVGLAAHLLAPAAGGSWSRSPLWCWLYLNLNSENIGMMRIFNKTYKLKVTLINEKIEALLF